MLDVRCSMFIFIWNPVHIRPGNLTGRFEINVIRAGFTKQSPILVHFAAVAHHLAAARTGRLKAGWTRIVLIRHSHFHLLDPKQHAVRHPLVGFQLAGMLFGELAKNHKHKLLLAAEGTGDTLALITWVVFGAAVVGRSIGSLSWQVVLYAVLSLTVVRMLPVFLVLAGMNIRADEKLFMGWFGPRGLASIVFAIIVINAKVPHAESLSMVVVCTVFLSLIAHGISANPLAKWLGKKENGQ